MKDKGFFNLLMILQPKHVKPLMIWIFTIINDENAKWV